MDFSILIIEDNIDLQKIYEIYMKKVDWPSNTSQSFIKFDGNRAKLQDFIECIRSLPESTRLIILLDHNLTPWTTGDEILNTLQSLELKNKILLVAGISSELSAQEMYIRQFCESEGIKMRLIRKDNYTELRRVVSEIVQSSLSDNLDDTSEGRTLR